MEADVYTVPSEVLFKNYSTSTGPQTRNLLIKNTTSQALHTVISYPFSPSFRLSAPAEFRAHLKPKPPHLILELPPKSTSKVIVELKPPSSTAADGPQFLHDSLLVLAGSVCILRVPVRAVPGAEPVPAAAVTSFWPPQKEIDAHCDSFTSQVKAMYDTLSASRPAAVAAVPAVLRPAAAASVTELMQPGTALRAPMVVGSEVAESSGAASGALRSSSMGASGTSAPAAAPTLLRSGSGSTAAVVPPAAMVAAVIPAAAASQPTPELPPEGFSQPEDLYDDAGDVLYDEDGDVVQQPFVLHKTVKVQGRVAVAVPVDGGDGGAAAAAVGSTSNGRSSGGPGLLSLPPGNSLSRTNSTSSFTAAAGGAAAVGLGGNGSSRPGSASGGKLAFALNGKLYDARGTLLDPSLEQVSAVGSLMVVDCGEGAPSLSPSPPQQQPQPQQQQAIRTSSSGTSLTSLTPPRLSTPPGSGNGSGGAGAGGSATGLSPGPGSSRVSLAPLKYGNLPVTASLRPGSAASSMSPHLGRPPPPPPAYTGSAGPGVAAAAAAAPSSAAGAGAGGSDDDPLRKAALAAALRELGIRDLPTPSPRRPPSSGQMPTITDGLHQTAGAGTLLSGLSPPSYLQYGLPPNYRPSSGRRRPPSATGSAAAYGSGGDEDADGHDDADLEAKFVQQIESNVLKAAGPAAAPAPRRTVGPCAAASPGSYLPPRAGAASTGGLGAHSAAAANAAAVAAGSRMGKAAAAAAAAAGGTSAAAAARRTVGQYSSGGDTDYPEESEFEVQLQRQIDSDVAHGGGVTSGGGGGGGAGWRGSNSTRGAAKPRLSGLAGTASGSGATTGVLKRASSSSGTTAVAAAGGVMRASADAATATASDKGPTRGSAVATRTSSGPGTRQQTGGESGNGTPGLRQTAPKLVATAGVASKPVVAAAASKSTAGKATAAAAVAGAASVAAAGGGSGGAGVQRMKANWDALG